MQRPHASVGAAQATPTSDVVDQAMVIKQRFGKPAPPEGTPLDELLPVDRARAEYEQTQKALTMIAPELKEAEESQARAELEKEQELEHAKEVAKAQVTKAARVAAEKASEEVSDVLQSLAKLRRKLTKTRDELNAATKKLAILNGTHISRYDKSKILGGGAHRVVEAARSINNSFDLQRAAGERTVVLDASAQRQVRQVQAMYKGKQVPSEVATAARTAGPLARTLMAVRDDVRARRNLQKQQEADRRAAAKRKAKEEADVKVAAHQKEVALHPKKYAALEAQRHLKELQHKQQELEDRQLVALRNYVQALKDGIATLLQRQKEFDQRFADAKARYETAEKTFKKSDPNAYDSWKKTCDNRCW